MSPDDQRRAAEDLLADARRYPLHYPARLALLAEAQVRATLATLPDNSPAPKRATRNRNSSEGTD